MNWYMVVSGTAFALLLPAFLLWRQQRRIRKGKQHPPTYEKLVRDHDALLFMTIFLNLWVFFVAPYWNWNLGNKTSGLYITMFCLGSGKLASWLLHRSDRSEDAI